MDVFGKYIYFVDVSCLCIWIEIGKVMFVLVVVLSYKK